MATNKKKTAIGIGVGGAIAALIAAIAKATHVEPGIADCLGQVVDQDNMPLEGVTITLNGYITLTDNEGDFTFMGVESGSYSLTVSKVNFGGKSMSITLAPGQSKNIGTIQLIAIVEPTCSIFGYVISTEPPVLPMPIEGILVQIGAWQGMTDASGYFDISDITAGTYSVIFSDPQGRYEPKTI